MSQKIHNLQALRFAAALMVVLYHTGAQLLARHVYLPFGGLAYIGYAGVDLFFVISGFVLWKSTANARGGMSDGLKFVYRRITRIFLPYLPIALLMGVIYYFWGVNHRYEMIVWWKTLTLWPADIPELSLIVSWTLTYEMFFYLILGVGFFFPRWRLASLAFVAGAVAFNIVSRPTIDSSWLTVATNPMFLEFLFGCAIAALPRIRFPVAALIVGVAGFGATWVYFGLHHQVTPAVERVATYGVSSSFIVYGLVGLEERMRAGRALTFLGDASYALYLIHVPVINLVYRILPSIGLTFFETQLALSSAVIVVLSVAFSALYYVYVEKRLLRWSRSVIPTFGLFRLRFGRLVQLAVQRIHNGSGSLEGKLAKRHPDYV